MRILYYYAPHFYVCARHTRLARAAAAASDARPVVPTSQAKVPAAATARVVTHAGTDDDLK